jgi:hypothetical protein
METVDAASRRRFIPGLSGDYLLKIGASKGSSCVPNNEGVALSEDGLVVRKRGARHRGGSLPCTALSRTEAVREFVGEDHQLGAPVDRPSASSRLPKEILYRTRYGWRFSFVFDPTVSPEGTVLKRTQIGFIYNLPKWLSINTVIVNHLIFGA